MSAAERHFLLRYALLTLVALAPLVDGGTTYVPATLIRVGALGLAVGWLWHAAGPGGTWRQATPLDLPVVLFMTLAALSTLASGYPYQSLQAFLGLASGALVFAVAAEITRDRRGAAWLVGIVVGGAVAQALLALAQLAASGNSRPAGTYFNPNHLATALAMAGALLLALEPARRAGKVGRWVAWLLVGSALTATASRGGVLAAVAGWGIVGWWRWRWRAVAAAAAAAVALAVVPSPLTQRLRQLDTRDHLAYTRLQIWQSAVQRSLDHPFGVGLNLFRQSSQQYAFPVEGDVARYGRRAESAHSDYLQILAELGPVGLVLVLWGLGALALHARRVLRDPAPGDRRPLQIGAAGALAAVATQALVDTPLHVPGLVVQASALAGLLLSAPPTGAEPTATAYLRRPVRWPVRVAVAALGCVAAVGIVRHGLAYLAIQRAGVERAAGPQAALPWLERAAWLAPDNAAYQESIAAARIAAWRESRDPFQAAAAEQAMLRAIRLDALGAERRARLARLYREVVPADPALRRLALDRAKALYEEAERLDPYECGFPFARADLLLQLGDEGGALAALERAVALEPRFLPARLALARLQAARGERDAARAQYRAIEATLAVYQTRPALGPFAREFLAVDRSAVRREAASLGEGSS